jgi:hypothetical protein
MEALDRAVLRTVLYGDVFGFPMTAEEIHHFLIASSPATLAEVRQALAASPMLQKALVQVEGTFARAGRADLAALRTQREHASQHLLKPAQGYGRWLARIPFVRMVGVTGALAMHNAASPHDDIDYILVTAPGRVWLARAFAILCVRVGRVRGVTLCPNFVVAETALAQPRQDLYVAHEIAQVLPLYGEAHYRRLREHNPWVPGLLPNASMPFHPQPQYQPCAAWRALKAAGEWALGGPLGSMLERWEARRKRARFAQHIQAGGAARIDAEQVKGHFHDHGHPVLVKYHGRLAEHDLLPAAGD